MYIDKTKHFIILKIELFSRLKNRKCRPCGSILVEVLISILLLSFIVLGSIYSYSFVHHRIRRQLQQRMLLNAAQGWMEQTRAHLINIAEDNTMDPNSMMTAAFQQAQEDLLKEKFDREIKDIFKLDTTVASADVDLNTSDNNFLDILITAELRGLPIRLFTQFSPNIYREIKQ